MKKFLSLAALALLSTSLFSACSDDDNEDPYVPVEVTTAGVYVINEGSFYSNINGSASYYDLNTKQTVADRFQSVNGRSLGGTPNDAVLAGQYIYIATTDENRVEIADAATMKSVATVSVKQPRELTMSGDGSKVFVSSYSGRVYAINTASYALADSSEVVGTNLEGIGVAGGYVYVCNAWNNDYTYNTNVVKLDASLNKVKDITVKANPTQIEVMDDNVYVVSMGNYQDVSAVCQLINASTDAVTEIAPATLIAATHRRLYLVNAPYGSTPTYSVAAVSATGVGSVEKWIDGEDIVSPYAMACDLNTDRVYISSSAADPDYGGASYTLPGYVVAYDANGVKQFQFGAGLNPGTILFHYAVTAK